jgi:Tfp pilus assembly ATPase PilU
MQTFDQHLLDLLRANKIAVETALRAASNPADFQTKLALEGHEESEEPDGEKPMEQLEIDSDGRF